MSAFSSDSERVLKVRYQVPEFKWHIIEEGEQFDLAGTGILVTPFQGRSASAHV
jgi:hypothetical protein